MGQWSLTQKQSWYLLNGDHVIIILIAFTETVQDLLVHSAVYFLLSILSQ